MARFVVEYRYPDGPRREVYVTESATATLNGTQLHDGGEIKWRGRRWSVELIEDGDDRYVLTPIARGA